jgi:hypothetical protein
MHPVADSVGDAIERIVLYQPQYGRGYFVGCETGLFAAAGASPIEMFEVLRIEFSG